MCTDGLGLKSPWFGNILVVKTNQFGEVVDFDENDEIQARDIVVEYDFLFFPFSTSPAAFLLLYRVFFFFSF